MTKATAGTQADLRVSFDKETKNRGHPPGCVVVARLPAASGLLDEGSAALDGHDQVFVAEYLDSAPDGAARDSVALHEGGLAWHDLVGAQLTCLDLPARI
jgi:hypothetical protein